MKIGTRRTAKGTAAPKRSTRAKKINYRESSSGSQSSRSSSASSYKTDNENANNAANAMAGLKIASFSVDKFFENVKGMKNENEIHTYIKATIKNSPDRMEKIVKSGTVKQILERNSPNANQQYAVEYLFREAFDNGRVREHIKSKYADTPGLTQNPASFGLRRTVRGDGQVIFSRTPGRRA
jgi:hypothetical protein